MKDSEKKIALTYLSFIIFMIIILLILGFIYLSLSILDIDVSLKYEGNQEELLISKQKLLDLEGLIKYSTVIAFVFLGGTIYLKR